MITHGRRRATILVGGVLAISTALAWLYWAVCWRANLWSIPTWSVSTAAPLAAGALFVGVWCAEPGWARRTVLSLLAAAPLSFGVLIVQRLPLVPDGSLDLKSITDKGPGMLMPTNRLALNTHRCGSSATFRNVGKSGAGTLELFVACPFLAQPKSTVEVWAGLRFANPNVGEQALRRQEKALVLDLRRHAEAWLRSPSLRIYGLSPAPPGYDRDQWHQAAVTAGGSKDRPLAIVQVHRGAPKNNRLITVCFGLGAICAAGLLWISLADGRNRVNPGKHA